MPPGITGEFISKDGLIRVNPDGRVEIVVEPRTAK
jgi:acylphosphatase